MVSLALALVVGCKCNTSDCQRLGWGDSTRETPHLSSSLKLQSQWALLVRGCPNVVCSESAIDRSGQQGLPVQILPTAFQLDF